MSIKRSTVVWGVVVVLVMAAVPVLLSVYWKRPRFSSGEDISDKISPEEVVRSITESSYQKANDLGPDLQLLETHSVEECPFTGMADNDQWVAFAIPSRSDTVTRQTLVWRGKSVYISEREKTFHVSPDTNCVVVADALHVEPFEILNLSTDSIQTVSSPETGTEGHYNEYPFSFTRWSDDSLTIYAIVTGTFVKAGPKRGFMAYRDLWRIDAVTGKALKEHRQTQPWQEELSWPEESEEIEEPSTEPSHAAD